VIALASADPIAFLAVFLLGAFFAVFFLALLVAEDEPICDCPVHILKAQDNDGSVVRKVVHERSCINYQERRGQSGQSVMETA